MTYELNGECECHIFKARFNAAIRKCIKTVATVDKVDRLTEAAQRANNRIKSRQILLLLNDRLGAANIGEQSFRIIELSNLRRSNSTFNAERSGSRDSSPSGIRSSLVLMNRPSK